MSKSRSHHAHKLPHSTKTATAKEHMIDAIASDRLFQALTMLTVFFILLGIVLYILSAVWLLRMRKTCTCSQDWRTLFLLIFPPVAFIAQSMVHYHVVTILAFAGWIVYIVFTHRYLDDLKKKKCECAFEGDLPLQVFQWFPVVMWTMFAALVALTLVKMQKIKRSIKTP